MALTINDLGHNNEIDIVDPERIVGTLTINGSGNRIHIGEGSYSAGLNIEVGDSCQVHIGNHCRLSFLRIYALLDAQVKIGDAAGFTWDANLFCHEPSSISIGKGFLCAGNVTIITSDMHSIFDQETGHRTNPSRSIVIEDHVWIGYGTSVLKGSVIGSRSVLGAHSVVSRPVPPNVVVGGNPAKIIRRKIYWKHALKEVDEDYAATKALPTDESPCDGAGRTPLSERETLKEQVTRLQMHYDRLAAKNIIKKSRLYKTAKAISQWHPAFRPLTYPFVSRGEQEIRNRLVEAGFDAAFYTNANPEVFDTDLDPLIHFIRIGYTQGRPFRLSPPK